MSVADQKRRAARAALEHVAAGAVLGVGTGSTADLFIEQLADLPHGHVAAAVASSRRTARRLRAAGIPLVGLDEAGELGVYVDGADEFDPDLALLKGGGAALTGEKIVASASRTFVCIVDSSKRVDVLGEFPLPIELLAMAQAPVDRRIRALGGEPRLRDGVLTEHGNPIIDVHGLRIDEPAALETILELTPGVVTCGIFAHRRADLVLMGSDGGVERFERR